jgi:hypothetical protein
MLATERLDQLLTKYVQGSARTAHAAWSVELNNGRPHGVRARLEGDFLVLEAATGAGLPPERMLELNHALPPGARFVMSADGEAVLRGEVARRLEPAALEARLASSLAALTQGLEGAAGKERAAPSGGKANWAEWDREGALEDAGWAYSKRSDGTIALQLPARRHTRAAVLTVEGESCRIAVEILARRPESAPALQALATLLLRATGAVHLVRASAGEAGDVRLETCFETPPDPLELEAALAALALAAGSCAGEAATVLEERVARLYLAFCSSCRAQAQSRTKGGG